ncbi:hypothetical protein Cenrod_1996 [Candidatus Symbiobacter mobilis CR]|uniref:Uncharacterized protein n=1 Tax=Candidatus Symbiobacter mobilis CR TaxID=946483 RepID=U5ND25_9BURK|nr:hypothetical protein Cenrod_1996 [Candidatus Symbiobacter mobilis CR]
MMYWFFIGTASICPANPHGLSGFNPVGHKKPNRVARRFLLPAPTPAIVRVRSGRFHQSTCSTKSFA